MTEDKSNSAGTPDSAPLTPMVRQYNEIKARHRDKILLFRVGDFYEMFFDDARQAAGILNIALTSRNDMPMAGFPYHAASGYIQKLIAAGKKAAVCEQLEDPSKAKGLVKRDIVSIITPGTILDENQLEKKRNNYLLSVYGDIKNLGLSFMDISTGSLHAMSGSPLSSSYDRLRLVRDLSAKFSPSEIIYNENLKTDKLVLPELQNSGILNEVFPEWYFGDFSGSEISLKFPELGEDRALRKSLLGLFHYIFETQGEKSGIFFKNIQSALQKINIMNGEAILEMDDFTIRNLELVRNMQDGSKKYTLLDVIDSTLTPMGGRLLRQWIMMPLFEKSSIYKRQNLTEAFFDDPLLVSRVREILLKIGDIERLSSRIAMRRIIPKEVVALSSSLKYAPVLKKILAGTGELKDLAESLPDLSCISAFIDSALLEEPSSSFGGEVIKEGFDGELDKERSLLREGHDYIVKLQAVEREKTGISSLKVRYNNIFGYFIEVSKSNLGSVPENYTRKQSLVNAERFTIPELSEFEEKINRASEIVSKLEEEIFSRIVEKISESTHLLQEESHIIAEIDVFSSFALTAKENDYKKPVISEDSQFVILDGRHPVVEKYMGRNLFVPNDARLDDTDNRIIILTGPNMAGKSTYLRQNALIAIMAQIGSYVPAREARIGLIDRIFTRIGASDNLSQGESTFLVEMKEAANIIRGSTPKSLIIMDELGRGTSTYDGLSIAWSVIEYLHEHPEKAGRTLFATHYHELTRLGLKKGIVNFNIAVREYRDELVFLRKVIEGPADRSYGIYVAKLAGIPSEIIERAKIILETLESEGDEARSRIETIFDNEYRKGAGSKTSSAEIGLFTDNTYASVADKIKNIDINRITPLEAIAFLAEIKKTIT